MKVTLESKETTASFDAAPGERILYAGLKSGVALSYECASGTCGQCKAKLVAGQIDNLWPQAPGNTYVKKDKGEILMCQSAALDDCTIRVTRPLLPFHTSQAQPALRSGTIEQITPLARDVLQLKLSLYEPMHFMPGQFAVLSADGVEGPRAYSMACKAPSRSLEFLIKRKSKGRMTEWFFAQAAVGTTIDVFGPLGSAVFQKEVDKDLLLISGSSGLSTTLSILRAAMGCGHFGHHRADVFFGVRSEADIFYAEELTEIKRACPNVAVTVCLSEQQTAPAALDGKVTFAPGFVHDVVAKHRAREPLATTAFLAGPPPMVDATLRVLLKDCKIAASRIRYDKFS